MKRNNKKGFTIVELVIVIAVIAILSAVLIPTFGSVIADANEVARDEEAKNIYTTYITKTVQAGKDPVTEGFILVDGYVYLLHDGNVEVEDKQEEGTGVTAPAGKDYGTFADAVHGVHAHTCTPNESTTETKTCDFCGTVLPKKAQ